MKNIFIYIQLCAVLSTISCNEKVNDDSSFDATDPNELLDLHSFFYDTSDDNIPEDAVEFQIKSSKLPKLHERAQLKTKNTISEDSSAQEKVFYKRLIKLLLSNMYIYEKNGEFIKGILTIQASPSQIERLGSYGNDKISIREIDAILSDIIKKHNQTYFETIVNLTVSVHEILEQHWKICIGIVASVIIIRIIKTTRWTLGLIILTVTLVLFVASFFMTWWKLLEEAEIKLMATQVKFMEKPIACEPHRMNIWDKMVSLISSNDDCEKYYEARILDPKLQVTPAFVLSHFLSTVILHPVSCIGYAISEFTENATSKLPFMYRWIVILGIFMTFSVVIILVTMRLNGLSINLGIGPFFKFGINSNNRKERQKSVKGSGRKEPIEVIHKIVYDKPQLTAPNVLDNEMKVSTSIDRAIKHKTDDMCITEGKEEKHKSNHDIDETDASGDASSNISSKQSSTLTDNCVESVVSQIEYTELASGDN